MCPEGKVKYMVWIAATFSLPTAALASLSLYREDKA
jgi:hypothetical protein